MLLILILLVGCADGRFVAAEQERASAEQVESALSVAGEARRIGRSIPEYPDACRLTHRSGVKEGDRLDAALVKTDRSLSRANGQIRECAGWYDEMKAGIEGAED
ncbi:hypothetical protein OEG86_13485 [Hoeflea alexandrii]|uniref:hypothetical protein n=1 Tax=Hoeflea alexandrii TaxID=288436 RepID=UPI00226E9530|nr:hypothetical protein [Hoeflea alexandrii]MCY0153088.1 hypothetical protein [Hoeflea alexandrii]